MIWQNMILIDNEGITDPALNLAIEEYAVRHFDSSHSYLLLYINQPSVILGKHQNVFQEVNLRYVFEQNIPILRRLSGGGAVYHDSGNLNFCFITNHAIQDFNNYRRFVQPIFELLRESGASAGLNERNNIILNGLKVSGNAQFSSRGRMLSHGTLLFESDLNAVSQALLINREDHIESRATRSIPSPITNIRPHLKQAISIRSFKEIISDRLSGKNPARYNFSTREWQEIHQLSENKYRAWEWNFALSPECRVHRRRSFADHSRELGMEVKAGRIRTYKMLHTANERSMDRFIESAITGMRFHFADIDEKIRSFERLFFKSNWAKSDWLNLFF